MMTVSMTSTPDQRDRDEFEFGKARLLLSQLLSSREIVQELEAGQGRPNSRMVYTQASTLWLLILQRLGGGMTQQEAVQALLEHHRDLLPENRRVVEGTLSSNTSAYHQARKRIPLSTVKNFSHVVCDHLAARAEPAFLGQRVFIFDGTTITLPPTPELKKAYPPATNQLGETAWPVALLLVAHELQTGCALVPQIDPMYGPNNSSETRQAIHAIEKLPAKSIVLADSGFGIFSVAWHCHQHQHSFLFRLSKQRFKCHLKSAKLFEEEPGHRTYHLRWKPSRHEQQANPQIPATTAIDVWIHQVELENGETLELISNLEIDAISASRLYQRRYDVEFDIRDLKVTMDTEKIRAKSVDTVHKELWGSILAYNLVMQFRRQAAQLQGIAPRELSFTGVWITFQYELLQAEIESLEVGQLIYARALINASKRRLPRRKTVRRYPRIALPRRKKSTKFQKELIKQKVKAAEKSPIDPPL